MEDIYYYLPVLLLLIYNIYKIFESSNFLEYIFFKFNREEKKKLYSLFIYYINRTIK